MGIRAKTGARSQLATVRGRHTAHATGSGRSKRPGCEARAQLSTADSLLRNLERQPGSVRAQLAAGELQPLDLVNARLVYEASARDRPNALLSARQALGELEDAIPSPLTL
ncbi:MAG TPA: hypothetical protein VN735_12665 [Steroidobacteraceae bacterium]|nr:hypothetical protein [Steroidobacteraceae bacterium]